MGCGASSGVAQPIQSGIRPEKGAIDVSLEEAPAEAIDWEDDAGHLRVGGWVKFVGCGSSYGKVGVVTQVFESKKSFVWGTFAPWVVQCLDGSLPNGTKEDLKVLCRDERAICLLGNARSVPELRAALQEGEYAGLTEHYLAEFRDILVDPDAFKRFAEASLSSIQTLQGRKLRKLVAAVRQAEQAECSESVVEQGRLAVEYDRYCDPAGLESCISSGSVAFVKGRFLIDLLKGEGKVKRRQDLPPEAFWTAAEVTERAASIRRIRFRFPFNNYNFNEVRGQQFLHALSYGWLDKGHPDPDGYHLRLIVKVIERRLEFLNSIGSHDDIAIFWDFLSLFQAPRTEEEDRLFRQGLKAANLIYGHTNITTLIQTKMRSNINAERAYLKRGWCRFERAVSTINKPQNMLIDVGLVAQAWTENLHPAKYQSTWEFVAFIGKQGANTCPPRTPEHLNAELDETSFTNGRTDAESVKELYASTFRVMAATMRSLHFTYPAWGLLEARVLAESLPDFISCTQFQIFSSKLGQEAAPLLKLAWARMPALTDLRVQTDIFGPYTSELLFQSLPTTLTHLRLVAVEDHEYADIDNGSLLRSLEPWVRASPELRSIDVGQFASAEFKETLESVWQAAGKEKSGIEASYNN
mmetsp:Transcript_14505/g.30433  ORF Transcript_14505/g.30433 Transcript_14505/m.30433 type:complete len:639 (-) Transcript_14505:63-1979(-)